MRTIFFGGLFFGCLLGGSGLLAQRLWVRAAVGEEREDFHWSIAGNSAGQDPNVYSELKWRGVGGPVGRIELEWNPLGRWRVLASGSQVFSRSGSMADTDYGLDNRYDPIYHQRFAVHAGHCGAWGVAAGYSIEWGRWRLTPYIGYAVNDQYFPVTDPAGSYESLNSSYAAKWFGPLVKADGTWQLSGRWQVVADVVYHQVRYHATADWNLIPEFAHPVSFTHVADGYGFEGLAGLRWGVARSVAVSFKGGYFGWETGTGVDQLYLSTGGSDQTQLNGVVRHGWGVGLGVEIGLF